MKHTLLCHLHEECKVQTFFQASKYVTTLSQAIATAKEKRQEMLVLGNSPLSFAAHEVIPSDDIKFFAKVSESCLVLGSNDTLCSGARIL